MKRVAFAIAILLICASALAATHRIVRGRVTLATGVPAGGVTVQLRQVRFKGSALLASATTRRDGTYQIKYLPRGAKGVTILIRILDRKGKKLYQSSPIKKARATETINVVLP